MRGVFNIVMRIFSSLLGVLVVLLGLIWIGQAFHVGPAWIMGSPMVNHIQWAFWGALLAAFGVGQVIWTNTRKA